MADPLQALDPLNADLRLTTLGLLLRAWLGAALFPYHQHRLDYRPGRRRDNRAATLIPQTSTPSTRASGHPLVLLLRKATPPRRLQDLRPRPLAHLARRKPPLRVLRHLLASSLLLDSTAGERIATASRDHYVRQGQLRYLCASIPESTPRAGDQGHGAMKPSPHICFARVCSSLRITPKYICVLLMSYF